MAVVKDGQRFLIKKFFVYLKDLKDGCIHSNFSTASLTLCKHYNPKFKWLRSKKVIPVDLPDFNKNITKEEQRSRMKELGILPPSFYKDRPMTITCSREIIDPYQPPKGDGKVSFFKEGLKSLKDLAKEKKDDYLAMNKIKSYDPDFSTKSFPQYAHDIYVKAHTVLMKKDPEELSEFVTETAISEMMQGLKNKTLRWKFIESLEPPILIQARHESIVSNKNFFAQVTIRFHTKQTLAIYDRFGRLLYGHEDIPKDVLEYVVFEKHIVNEYGTWRLHGKIIPDWIAPIDSSSRTYRVEKTNFEEEEEQEEEVVDEIFQGFSKK